jgi:DNA-binding response OmpR family regulator
MPYVVLMLEISMSRMHGFTPYEKIRKIDTKIGVFFMTALGVDYERVFKLLTLNCDHESDLIFSKCASLDIVP